MSGLVFVLLALLAYVVYKHYQENKDFPPGYPRLPWVGCLFSVFGKNGSTLLFEATKMIPKFGKVIGIPIGQVRMAIINDFDMAKEMFYGDKFAWRVENHYHSNIRGYGRGIGIITTNGENWKSQRRFALSTLREFGFGKTSMSVIIADEAKEIILTLAKSSGSDFQINQTFNIPIFNILWRIVGGKRYKNDDPHLVEMQRILSEVFKHAFIDRPFPWLSWMFPSLFHVHEKTGHCIAMKAMFEEAIKEHQESLDKDSAPKDLIDVYLKEMQTNPALNTHDLIGMCMDFFEAGGETVGSTLNWVLMYLALEQDVQEKCFQEIQNYLGDKEPTLDDKSNLPYTEATVMEVQRISCVAPGSLDHSAKEDTWKDGYRIPKGSYVMYNIHHFHTDPEYWGDPDTFRPERFLDTINGQLKVVKPERFVPFGFGKRVCMGESLARAELFIFTVMILQAVKISAPVNKQKPDPLNFVAGLTKNTLPYYVRFQSR